jgi:hypothetical protein
LRRRTRSVVSSKLDWSQVPSRTICHLEDKYVGFTIGCCRTGKLCCCRK